MCFLYSTQEKHERVFRPTSMTNLNENYRVSFIHVVLRQEEIFVLPKHAPAHALTIQIKTT